MKRLWITAAILVVLCAATVLNVMHITHLTDQISDDLARAQQSARSGDWDRAAELTAQAEQDFQSQAFYLHITLRHSDIDAVEIAFQEVTELIAYRERLGVYAAANARLIAQLELLAESEGVTLQNIL